MSVEIARRTALGRGAAGRRPLFPAWLNAGWAKLGPLLWFYPLWIPATMLRGAADTNGLPIRRSFSAVEDIILTEAPNRWFQWALWDFEPARYVAVGIYFSWMVLPITAAIPMILGRRSHDLWRYMWFMLLLHYLAQPFFFAYPLEPPWMHHPDIPRAHEYVVPGLAGRDSNPYAPMPSLHVAIPFAMALWYGLRDPFGKLLAAYSALIAATVVFTGDHYIADAFAGWAFAGVIYAACRRLKLPLLPERDADRGVAPGNL